MRFPGNTDAPATVAPAPVLNIVFYVVDYFLLMLVMCSAYAKLALTIWKFFFQRLKGAKK